MNDDVQRAYNAIAMLEPDEKAELEAIHKYALDKMDLHMLRTTAWRIGVLLGNVQPDYTGDVNAQAYMAGYEDESK